ncbi:hypothetical protein APUTEX25_001182, partial [Auxenochlorella protothecoides]
MGAFDKGLGRMWAAVQEVSKAAANTGKNVTIPPSASIPGNLVLSPGGVLALPEALLRLATRVSLITVKGVQEERNPLHKNLVVVVLPEVPAWSAETIPWKRHVKGSAHRIPSHLEKETGT